jgi:SAM-dependent methyltransferase
MLKADTVKGMFKRIAKSILIGSPLEKPARKLHGVFRSKPQTQPEQAALLPETFKSFELPIDMTEQDLKNIFLSFSIDDSPVGELDPYVHDALYRFIHSWQLVKNEKGNCLELGANPYFITWLLQEHTELDLTLANYFGGEEGKGTQTLSWQEGTARKNSTFYFDHFNMEESRFPYDDASFDVVLYCEIIEHLLMNPVHTLKEIRRVMRPGGLLVVTTPNVARLGNVLAMADGRSIYDPYSGFGPYGRHNREFSMQELIGLLEFAGFVHESSFTADAHREDHTSHPKFRIASQLIADRPAHLGQYLFAAVRASGTPRNGLPGSLFRSYEPEIIDHQW